MPWYMTPFGPQYVIEPGTIDEFERRDYTAMTQQQVTDYYAGVAFPDPPSFATEAEVLPIVTAAVQSGTGALPVALRAAFVSYAAPPSGGDDAPVLQAAMDALAPNGGVVLLTPGTYLLHTQIVIPNKVILRGAGRDATVLTAHSSFPVSTPIVHLGPIPDGSLGFASRLEHCTVNAGGVTGSTCVKAVNVQEQSGLESVVLSNFKLHGFHAAGPGNADFGIDLVESYPHPAGATHGIFFDSNSGSNYADRVTVKGDATPLATGITAKSCMVIAQSIHVEGSVDGIRFDGAIGTVIGITGTVTANLVEMYESQHVTVFSADPYGAPVTIYDEVTTQAITGYVAFWAGNTQTARLHHRGDQLAFFNATLGAKRTVTGSRGGNAALTSLLTELAGYGLITDSTTA